MLRIGTATKAVDLFGAGKDGFKDGDVVGGIPPTDLAASFFNHAQEAIVRTIETAGLVLSGTDYDQFVTALNTLFVSKSSATGAATMPIGTTAQRKALPIAGDTRVNSTLGNILEMYSGAAWGAVGKIIQIVYERANSDISTTTNVQAIGATITPKSAVSRVLAVFFMGASATGGTSNAEIYATLRDGAGVFLGGDYSVGDGQNTGTSSGMIVGFYIDTPGAAVAKTYILNLIVGSAGTAAVSTGTRERGMLLLEIE